MTLDRLFCYTRIRFSGPGWQHGWPGLRTRLEAGLQNTGASIWGAFSGYFGLATNELVLLTHGHSGQALPPDVLTHVTLVEQNWLKPTVRPTTVPAPLERPGLYVFRAFTTAPEHVAEMAALSRQAWETFEDPTRYAAEPMALFASVDLTSTTTRMLLLTWYDGFESWEKSRVVTPEARDCFDRRQALTQGALPIATTLVRAIG